jgi:hypothetical protein
MTGGRRRAWPSAARPAAPQSARPPNLQAPWPRCCAAPAWPRPRTPCIQLHAYLRNRPGPAAPGRAGRTPVRLGVWRAATNARRRTARACWPLERRAANWTPPPTWPRWKPPNQKAAAAYLAEARKRCRACAHQGRPAAGAAITQAMQGLGMAGGRFEVALEKSAADPPSGLEDVELSGGRPCRQHAATRWPRWPRAASCRAWRWPLP